MEAGDYSDRCFYQTVLTTNNKIAEQAGSFVDYLDKTRVLSGEATKAAREQLGRDRNRGRTKRAMPKVWRTLLEGPGLRSLLASAVESECGAQPVQSDLDDFLRQQLQASPPPQPASRQPATSFARSNNTAPAVAGAPSDGKIFGYILNGQLNKPGSSRQTLAEV